MLKDKRCIESESLIDKKSNYKNEDKDTKKCRIRSSEPRNCMVTKPSTNKTMYRWTYPLESLGAIKNSVYSISIFLPPRIAGCTKMNCGICNKSENKKLCHQQKTNCKNCVVNEWGCFSRMGERYVRFCKTCRLCPTCESECPKEVMLMQNAKCDIYIYIPIATVLNSVKSCNLKKIDIVCTDIWRWEIVYDLFSLSFHLHFSPQKSLL